MAATAIEAVTVAPDTAMPDAAPTAVAQLMVVESAAATPVHLMLMPEAQHAAASAVVVMPGVALAAAVTWAVAAATAAADTDNSRVSRIDKGPVAKAAGPFLVSKTVFRR